MLAVGPDLQSADEQRRQNVFSFVIRPNADPATTRRNVRVIMRWDIVFTPISHMHYERLKWLCSQPIPNILRHGISLSKRPQKRNADHPRRTKTLSDAPPRVQIETGPQSARSLQQLLGDELSNLIWNVIIVIAP
jgi:hypothetical protein